MIKYTPQLLKKLEEVFTENGYKVRYEKGNFKSGFCIMEDRKIIVINKFAVVESRINTMIEILKVLHGNFGLEGEKFAEVNKQLFIQPGVEESQE